MDSFTKFDRLGDALRAASNGCDHVSLGWYQLANGREFFGASLHVDGKAYQGNGATPSLALANAITALDAHDRTVQIAAVESACEMERAA